MTPLKYLCAGLLLLQLPLASAANLGTVGDIYPIAETDFLEFIHRRLGQLEADGTLAREQDRFKQRVIENTLRPPAVAGIHPAKEYAKRLFNPSFVVDEDKIGANGQAFARKGEVINPLQVAPFKQTLYFIDGDDPAQLHWFKSQRPATLEYKVILVKGNVKETSDALASQIYFDQGGAMVQRFGIQAVPARVTDAGDGKHLVVEQFDPRAEP